MRGKTAKQIKFAFHMLLIFVGVSYVILIALIVAKIYFSRTP